MGEVAETVKGTPPKSATPAPTGTGNLNDRMQSLIEEVSRLTAIKDDDTITEGDAARAENTRKAGLLRAVSSLLRASKRMLEDY